MKLNNNQVKMVKGLLDYYLNNCVNRELEEKVNLGGRDFQIQDVVGFRGKFYGK